MSFEDKLRDEATLERWLQGKRDSFLADYGIGDKPALVWQCAPAQATVADVRDAALWTVVQEGGDSQSENGWWSGFRTRREPRPVFEGVSSWAPPDAPGYATEVHTDAHLVVGLWTFPEMTGREGSKGPAVVDFYTGAFADFAKLAVRVFGTVGSEGPLLATCTLTNANRLPLANTREQVLAPAPARAVLRWPIYRVDKGVAQLTSDAQDMATRFMRIYGRRYVPGR
jgi:hypothetical protein